MFSYIRMLGEYIGLSAHRVFIHCNEDGNLDWFRNLLPSVQIFHLAITQNPYQKDRNLVPGSQNTSLSAGNEFNGFWPWPCESVVSVFSISCSLNDFCFQANHWHGNRMLSNDRAQITFFLVALLTCKKRLKARWKPVYICHALWSWLRYISPKQRQAMMNSYTGTFWSRKNGIAVGYCHSVVIHFRRPQFKASIFERLKLARSCYNFKGTLTA